MPKGSSPTHTAVSERVPVMVMGLGMIGQEIVRAALASEEVELVGAIDKSPLLAGKMLSEIVPHSTLKARVCSTLNEAVLQKWGKVGPKSRRRPVLLHATGSRIEKLSDQLFDGIAAGFNVVSTCEELSFPYLRYPELAERLDRAAQQRGVSILGTGVNPGFVLDRLVATIGQACGHIRQVHAKRVVDARKRSAAFQRKIGAGLTESEFNRLLETDSIGMVGLVESTALCALGLGFDCDDFEEELFPLIAEEDISGGAFLVKKGRVAGIHQHTVGLVDGQERVRLEVTLAVGQEDPKDTIRIDGDPGATLEIPGGITGAKAIANILVNAAARVASAQPGLLTVLELPAGR